MAVPAYQAEQYLEKCLGSFCHPEALPALDIIVVNDGSSDRTSEIAHRYARRYSGSFRVIDKENGGHGSAINRAIETAKGAYFQAVDSDDWVVTENLPELVRILRNATADIVLCNYHMVDQRSGKKQAFRTERVPAGKELSFREFMRYPPAARDCCYYHGMIYRTDFYRSTGLLLSERIYYEDQEYATIPAYYARTVLPTDLFVYQYLVGSANQSMSSANQVRNMDQMERVFWTVCGFYMDHSEMPPEKKEYFLFKLSKFLESYYAAALLKDRARDRGLRSARQMRSLVRVRCPELSERAERGYGVSLLLHRLHMTSECLEAVKRTKFYHAIRKQI